MDAFLMTRDEFDGLIKKISDIEMKLEMALPFIGNTAKKWLTITETCTLLEISKRTLSRYRDSGSISFSQIGSKIYFSREDIQVFLDNNKVESFKKK